ncbi:hypothetical protein EGJ42_13000 [Stutzerimonas stutzeri]|nr:hypothetical protein EGJ42_13000 [Stutzerimonas stutzeri]
MQLTQAPAPGARAVIRDEEWIIQNADQCNLGGWQLSCIGVSEAPARRRHRHRAHGSGRHPTRRPDQPHHPLHRPLHPRRPRSRLPCGMGLF